MDHLVMLVEDDIDDEFIGRRILVKNGFPRIETARDGKLAIDRLFSERPLPSLVILDLKLPKIDGLKVLREIRNDHRTRALPVIVLSSSTNPDEVAAATSFAQTTYLCKPLTENTLRTALSYLGVASPLTAFGK